MIDCFFSDLKMYTQPPELLFWLGVCTPGPPPAGKWFKVFSSPEDDLGNLRPQIWGLAGAGLARLVHMQDNQSWVG